MSTHALDKYDNPRTSTDERRKMYRDLLQDYLHECDAHKVEVSNRKANQPIRDETPCEHFLSYTVTSGGKLWRWNCGWWPMDQQGNIIGPAIGHLAHRKKPKAKPSDAWIRLCRPYGPWRRELHTPFMTHWKYGNGHVLATDGVHAIFEVTALEGVKRKHEVAYSSLSEIKEIKTVNSVNKSPKREKTMSSLVMDLI